uniref:Uncharacterized protein LOC100176072 n=1 Tax=Phallusia mammillata TaxID=59560 RepID=A0A6F9DH44_9ASCI|nr:uncharacterized protein LOC100176072 [Phallusia mammillata]
MSGKKEYEIVKTASEVPKVGRSLDRVQNVFPPPKGRIDKRNLLPILATVVVWATCLPFAYRAWKNKKVENKIESIETEEPAEIEKPKKLRLSFKSYEEMGVKNFDSNRPTAPGLTVTVNEEKSKFSICLHC